MNTAPFPLKSRKVVLGHPFSGALYAYFDKQLNNGSHIAASKYHGYYKTLYGNRFETYIEIALTLALIYDTIILPPADNLVPDRVKYENDGEYFNPEFGLYFTWNDEANWHRIANEKIANAMADRNVKALLFDIPKKAHEQILAEVFLEVAMVSRFNATLFTCGRRQLLANKIAEIEGKKIQTVPTIQGKIVSNYLEITGLLFQPLNIESFYYLKSESALKNYAESFLNVLDNITTEPTDDVKTKLLYLIRDAIDADKLTGKISGIFEGGSTLMNYVGLIPVAGTIAGIAGIGADWAAKGADALNQRNKWYEFAGQISKVKSMSKISAALKNLP